MSINGIESLSIFVEKSNLRLSTGIRDWSFSTIFLGQIEPSQSLHMCLQEHTVHLQHPLGKTKSRYCLFNNLINGKAQKNGRLLYCCLLVCKNSIIRKWCTCTTVPQIIKLHLSLAYANSVSKVITFTLELKENVRPFSWCSYHL